MKISKTERGSRALTSLERRLRVSNRSEQTIRNYVRSVRILMDYHGQLPDTLDIDQVIDFLNDLQLRPRLYVVVTNSSFRSPSNSPQYFLAI